MADSKDRLWRVPEVATILDEDGEHIVFPEDEEFEHAMHEALAILRRVGGTLVIAADRTMVDDEDRWETVGLAFRYATFAAPMPRPRRVAVDAPVTIGEFPVDTEAVEEEMVEDREPGEGEAPELDESLVAGAPPRP